MSSDRIPFDVFQSKAYIDTDVQREVGSEAFYYQDIQDGNYLINVAIKRRTPKCFWDVCETELYDLESPYGYGGFRSNIKDKSLLEEFIKRYKEYCLKNNIVAEFYRNNPLNRFSSENTWIYDFFVEDRDTVFLEINNIEELRSNYASSLKRNIKKANKNGLVFRVVDKNRVYDFINLYKKTMDKNSATSFYYFNDSYFTSLVNNSNSEILGIFKGEELVNMAIFLKSGTDIYYHLGASEPQYYSLNGNPLLFDQAADYYSKQGFAKLYLGGGATTSKEDSLLRFKQKFSNKIAPFNISGIIFDPERYELLNSAWKNKIAESEYKKMFLQYRA